MAISLGGHKQRPTARKQDAHLVYLALVIELSDALGCNHEGIYRLWGQLALCREFHGEPRGVAEWLAWKNLTAVFQEQESN